MATIVSVHSFRGGTGKSNTTANIAAVLAARGRRVGVIDTDIQSPGIHILFGLSGGAITSALNDYLWGRCEIGEAARDMTRRTNGGAGGRVFLIPSSTKTGESVGRCARATTRNGSPRVCAGSSTSWRWTFS